MPCSRGRQPREYGWRLRGDGVSVHGVAETWKMSIDDKTGRRFLGRSSLIRRAAGIIAACLPARCLLADYGGRVAAVGKVRYWWHEAPVPAGLEITQVYGYLLCPVTYRVLV